MSVQGVAQLHTEQRNPDTIGFDRMSTQEMLQKINDEDQKIAERVREALPNIAKAVDLIVPRMRKGGRMIYVGAGTSGSLGFMDASECPPTYGVDYDRITCVMAGGNEAVFRAKESVEDQADTAVKDLQAYHLTELDTVVGVSASGRTPYCIGAMDYARSIGAASVCVVCNPNSEMGRHADVAIEMDTGCEVIMGSTRMKAGTAQKMAMNMLSTAIMVQLGRTYDNLMICLKAKNEKISNRIVRLFIDATGETDEDKAREVLTQAGGKLDVAVAMYMTGKDRDTVEKTIEAHEDFKEVLAILG